MPDEMTIEAEQSAGAMGHPLPYLDKKGVAAMLQLSVRTVDNLILAGCPHLKIGNRRVRFDEGEVREWLHEHYHTQRRTR